MLTGYLLWFTCTVVVGTEFESSVAVALVRSHRVEARSVVTDVWIALALVDIDAGIAARGQSVTVVADALERSLEVVTVAVVADSGTFVALVDICHVIMPLFIYSFVARLLTLVYH